jgi:hypothetical protein
MPKGAVPLTGATQPNRNPADFHQWLTQGNIYGQNPKVNVMQDFSTNYAGVPGKGGITPAFRSIVQQLTNQGNKLGVFDFNAGHTSLGIASPHAQGRAMDVDTVNGEPVGTRLSPNLGQFINQALQTDPRVRVGVPKEIFQQLGPLTRDGRIFVDDPAHIHIELDPMATTPGKAPATKMPQGAVPVGAKPVAEALPQYPHVSEAGVGEAVKNAWDSVMETGKGFYKEWHYEQGHPIEAYSDVEGVFQRAVSGYLSQTDPTGKAVVTPPTTQAVGMAIYDAFHPHSEEVQKRDMSADIRSVFAPLGVNEANQGTWAHFGQAIAAQSATDPVSYLPVVGAVLRGAQAAGIMAKMGLVLDDLPEVQAILKAKQAMLGKLANSGVKQFTDKYFGIRPELNDYLEPDAKTSRLMIEHSENAFHSDRTVADENLLQQHEEELRNLKPDEEGNYHLPEPIAQRYLQEPYVDGTPEMREEALRLGYRPTEAEAAKPPTGRVQYNLREDYQTLIRPREGETQEQAFERISGGEPGNANAGFEEQRTRDVGLGNDQYDITANRLRLGRNLIRRRTIDQKTEEYLAQKGGWKPGAPVKSVDALSDKAWTYETPWGPSLEKLSKESIKAFPLPHAIGNVGQLAWNKGGWTAVGLALKHAVTGLNPEQVERMKSLGLWAEYLGTDLTSPWRKKPLSYLGGKGVDWWIDHVSTPILNRLEGGFRQALLDLADHQHGFDPENLQNEYKKAKDVLDAMGDYQNLNKVTAVLAGALGAPFVAFGLSIVPKALAKALREHPERLAGSARMSQDLQADQGGPLPPGVRIGGGPNESFARMVTNLPEYMLSPSRTGPLSIPIEDSIKLGFGVPIDPKQQAGEVFQSYGGPIVNTVVTGFGMAHEPPPNIPALRAALLQWMTGRYLGKEPSEKAEQYFNRLEETGQYPKYTKRPRFRQ